MSIEIQYSKNNNNIRTRMLNKIRIVFVCTKLNSYLILITLMILLRRVLISFIVTITETELTTAR